MRIHLRDSWFNPPLPKPPPPKTKSAGQVERESKDDPDPEQHDAHEHGAVTWDDDAKKWLDEH